MRRALLNLQYSIVDRESQEVRQVGPRPGRQEVALRAVSYKHLNAADELTRG